jgi:HEAT repeat protein
MGSEAKVTIPILTELLRKDKDLFVRREAKLAFGKIGPAAVTPLIELLKDNDWLVRWSAVVALGNIGADAAIAVPAITDLFKEKGRPSPYDAVWAVSLIGSPAAIELLIELLSDGRRNVRVQAAMGLGRLGPKAKAAIPSLVDLLKEKGLDILWAAATALADIGGTEAHVAVAALMELVKSGDGLIRRAAAFSVWRIAPKSPEAVAAVATLTELLMDKDMKVRGAAASSLRAIGREARTGISALTQLLKDEYWQVRLFAAEALGDIGPDAKAAIPGLKELLSDKRDVVRQAAAVALGKIGSPAIPTLAELLKDKDASKREAAALAVAEMGSEAKSLVPALTALLKDDNEAVRKAADEALYNVTKER